jgi:ribA/ribD-fused uncharacterized protein
MIKSFTGEYRFLSNFYPSPMVVELPPFFGLVRVLDVEHPYQAAKCTSKEDATAILSAKTPGMTKRLIRKMDQNPAFQAGKYDVMEYLVTEKFKQNLDLGDKLIATGDQELIEGNTWGDIYWGICRAVGENNLGRILMDVRTQLSSSR